MTTLWWVVLSIIGWGVGSIFYRQAGLTLHPLMVSAVVTCLFVVITPLAFVFLQFDRSLNWDGIRYALLGGIFMCMGTLGYLFALKSGGGVGRITILTALYPALTLGISMLFFKETMDIKKGIGIGLALVSFILLNLK